MIDSPCPLRRLSPDPASPEGRGWSYWVGYYDKQPWSPASIRGGRAVLCHRARLLDRMPGPDDVAEIGLLEDGRFTALATTRAWNWQQGAQAQWVGEQIVFNDRVSAGEAGAGGGARDDGPGDVAVARVIDSAGRVVRTLDDAVYTVDEGSMTGLTLDYARLFAARAEYGYPGLAGGGEARALERVPRSDGVRRVDVRTGRSRVVLTMAQLLERVPCEAPPEALHYVNHLMFARPGPQSSLIGPPRACFMHRFERADGTTHSRLFTMDAEGGDLRLLFEGFVSHYGWKDGTTLLAWAGRRALMGSAGSGAGGGAGGGGGAAKPSRWSPKALVRRSLKPVYHALGKPRFLMSLVMKDAYFVLRDEPGWTPARAEVAARGELTTDGHCTYSPLGVDGGRYVLTDGYPDMRGRQPLFVWDTTRAAFHRVGRYATVRELDGPVRVDLHPRFSRDGTRVCIDSAMDGTRGVWEVDVSALTRG